MTTIPKANPFSAKLLESRAFYHTTGKETKIETMLFYQVNQGGERRKGGNPPSAGWQVAARKPTHTPAEAAGPAPIRVKKDSQSLDSSWSWLCEILARH